MNAVRFLRSISGTAAVVTLSAALLGVPGGGAPAADLATLSKGQMAQALTTALAAARTAGKGGWTATFTTALGPVVTTQEVTYDAANRRAHQQMVTAGRRYERYAVSRRGTYTTLADVTSRAAVTMMGRPGVKYAFGPDPALDAQEFSVSSLGGPPAVVDLSDVSFDGTRAQHRDGSVDYRYLDDSADVTVHVSAAGAMRGYERVSANYFRSVAYTFGSQTVSLPPASAVVTNETLATGLAALDLATQVRTAADLTAAVSRATRALTVTALRRVAAAQAAAANRRTDTRLVRVTNVAGGARLSATNPWTKATVGYTVTTDGSTIATARR